jgi:nucleoside-triphosphatase THEP1
MSLAELKTPSCRIAALHGAPSGLLQPLLEIFAQRRALHGARIAGVIEVETCKTGGGCKSLGVRELTSGETLSITQDLGVGSMACNLDASGLAKACVMVERAIYDGADVVILSKFGKLEAARGGLSDAFRAAMLTDTPVVTTVPEPLLTEWACFAGPLAEFVTAEGEALEDWWRSQSEAL